MARLHTVFGREAICRHITELSQSLKLPGWDGTQRAGCGRQPAETIGDAQQELFVRLLSVDDPFPLLQTLLLDADARAYLRREGHNAHRRVLRFLNRLAPRGCPPNGAEIVPAPEGAVAPGDMSPDALARKLETETRWRLRQAVPRVVPFHGATGEVDVAGPDKYVTSGDPAPEEESQQKEEVNWLMDRLKALDHEERSVVEMLYLQAMDARTAAESLGLSVATVYRRRNSAFARLRALSASVS